MYGVRRASIRAMLLGNPSDLTFTRASAHVSSRQNLRDAGTAQIGHLVRTRGVNGQKGHLVFFLPPFLSPRPPRLATHFLTSN